MVDDDWVDDMVADGNGVTIVTIDVPVELDIWNTSMYKKEYQHVQKVKQYYT